MTDIEKKAAAMMDALYSELVWPDVQRYPARRVFPPFEALCRAIEQHEAFRQEVSDAIQALKKDVGTGWDHSRFAYACNRFIIAKPDPLAECLRELDLSENDEQARHDATWLANAIAMRGGKIVWEDEQ